MTTERWTRDALEGLRERLAERDLEVLTSVVKHRFLTTKQIERLHFVDHATPLAATRICNRVLKRLHGLGVLRRLERRVGGVRAGSAGFVWSVGVAGDGLLRLDSGRALRRHHDEPSRTFLLHALAVADAHLSLIEAARRRAFELLDVVLEPASWRTVPGLGASATLRPDLYCVTASGEYEDHWFVEVDRGSESVPALLRKCAAYQTYRQSGREQDQLGTFPLVVWLLPDEMRRERLAAAIERTRALDPALFRLALHEQLPELVQAPAQYLTQKRRTHD